jgi:carbamoyl-phosphate synthase small subunit
LLPKKKIYLQLENGKLFPGFSFGKFSNTDGEVVFTTGMTGYPESLTDPSYSGQILVFTYPLIGNYGIPKNKKGLSSPFESGKIQVRGIVISDYSFSYSHFDAVKSLHDWLNENNIPGIYGVDTRELTIILRAKGVMTGRLLTDKRKCNSTFNVEDPNMRNLASEVCTDSIKIYKPSGKNINKKIMLIDCGVKMNIIRNFLSRGAEVIRVPYDYCPGLSDYAFDGIFVSNGPGDPKMCSATIINIRKAFRLNLPVFGICLGSQIMALAAGADTYKLKFGHRSQNQPCIEINGNCYITSQNHGFAVETKTLPKSWEEWFVNNNDGTNEGIRHKSKPFLAVQFHPESSPGPNDTAWLFDEYINML